GYPAPSASVNTMPDSSLYQAVDGRIWYFPEVTNHWTTLGSTSGSDWYAVDFGEPREVSSVKLYLVTDGKTYDVPDAITIEYQSGGQWLPVKTKEQNPQKLTGNTANTLAFDKVTATGIRINFNHATKQVAVSEVECY
ncbi:MAG: discoidin domain-containing protein, partial [Bacteroidota bacterium]